MLSSAAIRSYSTNFIDTWAMHLQAGKGGKGGIAFFRSTANPRGKPCGGDGGRGGHVLIQADAGMDNLMGLEKQVRAGSGGAGAKNRQEGACGHDALIRVPLGTVITADAEGEHYNLPLLGWLEGRRIIADLDQRDAAPFLLCRGGKGGKGNWAMGANNHEAEAGQAGQELRIQLDLQTVADVGLVGMPNAGKSSLLACLTKAMPKIAPYAFTTLHPRKGMLDYPNGHQLSLCDIPGLIEGAHRNVGLGHAFLKHIVKSRLIAYIVDASRPAPWEDVAILDHELERYRPGLTRKRILIVANKMDLVKDVTVIQGLQQRLGEHVRIVPVSARLGLGLTDLKHQLQNAIKP